MSESGGRAYRGATNLVLCSDGTGNSGGKARGTNVWRFFNAVDRHGAAEDDGQPLEQRTLYDDGVGTDTLRLARALGGAFGWGLSRNLRQLYTFLVMNYEKGDQVFLFGFSRGAFTVRSLAGMICRCGLLDREAFLDRPPGERRRALRRILRACRSAKVMPAPSEGRPRRNEHTPFDEPWRSTISRSATRVFPSTSSAGGTPSTRSACLRRRQGGRLDLAETLQASLVGLS